MSLTPFNDIAENITIQAFKRSGKYYGSYDVEVNTRTIEDTNSLYMPDLFDAVHRKIADGTLPAHFYYLVDHPLGYPGLVNVPEPQYMGGRYA